MQHFTTIPEYKSLASVAEEIGNLRYDALSELLGHLARKLEKDATADLARHRPLCAGYLGSVSSKLRIAQMQVDKLWKICKPRMNIPA